MLQTLQNISFLAKSRIQFLVKHGDGDFFVGSSTFFNGILEEMSEVKEELISGKKVYLEDELGDVYWDYICLLETLEHEGKIDKARVFERCYTKYSERLSLDGSNNGDWMEVKQKQKIELEKEHNSLT